MLRSDQPVPGGTPNIRVRCSCVNSREGVLIMIITTQGNTSVRDVSSCDGGAWEKMAKGLGRLHRTNTHCIWVLAQAKRLTGFTCRDAAKNRYILDSIYNQPFTVCCLHSFKRNHFIVIRLAQSGLNHMSGCKLSFQKDARVQLCVNAVFEHFQGRVATGVLIVSEVEVRIKPTVSFMFGSLYAWNVTSLLILF